MVCVLAGASSIPGAQQSSSAGWTAKIDALPSPAGSGSAQPQITTSARGLLLSWIEQNGQVATLKFAERTPTGWTTARVVASGSDWFVNWADVPSVLRLADGTLVGHWLQKSGAGTYAYDVRLSSSRDDGRTWSRSVTPHSDGTKTEHGFASLFEMPAAGLGLVWLDGRAMKSASGHDDHGTTTGAMSVRFGTFDRQWKQTAEAPIDLRVCECCPTSAAMTSDGPIVAYRNRTDDEIRDIYVSRLDRGRWTEPKPVFHDNWKINACPVNGPMLSARGRDVVIAWFTAEGGQGRASAAFSRDAGRTFDAPIRLDDGTATGRVDVELMSGGSALASWIEFAGQGAQFRARRVSRAGERSPAVTVSTIPGSRASGYPRIGSFGDEIVFAWTEGVGGTTQVRTAVTRLGPVSTR